MITFNMQLSVLCVLVIVIAPCLALISITTDMKYELGVLNTSARTNESPFKVTQQFNQFVLFHSKAKQLSKRIPLNNFNFRYILNSCFPLSADWPMIFQKLRNSYSSFISHGRLEASAWPCLQSKTNWLSEMLSSLYNTSPQTLIDEFSFNLTFRMIMRPIQ